MRVVLIGLIITLTSFFATGCWDQKEMEELAFAGAIGFDQGPNENEVLMTIEIATPNQVSSGPEMSGGNDPKGKSLVYSATGETYTMAMERLQQIVTRRIFLSHLKAIIISEETAKQNMNEVIRFLERASELRRTVNYLVVPGKAQNVLTTAGLRVHVASEEIRFLTDRTEQTGIAFGTSLRENLLTPLALKGIEPIVTRVIATKAEKTAEESNIANAEEMPGDQGSESYILQQNGILRVSGMAAFRRKEFVGWLNEQESRGWGWIVGRMRRGYSIAENVTSPTGENEKVTFQYTKGNSKITVNTENGKAFVQVKVKVTGVIVEWSTGENVIEYSTIKKLEENLAGVVKEDMEAVLKRAQKELNTDIFGFGFQLSRKNNRVWKEDFQARWDEVFPEVPVEVEVKATILNTGTVTESVD